MDAREWYLCYVCGQNWIDQMYRHLTCSEHTVTYAYDHRATHEKKAFGWLTRWDLTPQGRAVWTRRCDETNRYVFEKEFNH